MRYVNYYNII